MASVEKRGNAYRAVVRLPSGKKSYATRDTKAEAEAWGVQQEAAIRIEKLTAKPTSTMLVEEMFELYEKAVASLTDSAKWNSLRIAKWSLDPISTLVVTDVKTHDVNEWIGRRAKSKWHGVTVSGSTVNRELNLMSGAFQYAVDDLEVITVNPCHGARRPASNPPRDAPLLTPGQVKALCTATGYDRDRSLATKTARVGACFLLAMETAMRSGEILRVKPADYWKNEQTVRVTATEKGGRKGAMSGRARVSSARSVPLTARAIELLDQLLASMPADQPYIVGLNDSQRDALWRKAVTQSGLDDVHFHDMKHEAATRLAPHIDVLALSHAIGTKDIRLLRDTYYNSDAQRSAALLPKQLAP